MQEGRLTNLAGFNIDRVLGKDARAKRVTLLGTFVNPPAVGNNSGAKSAAASSSSSSASPSSSQSSDNDSAKSKADSGDEQQSKLEAKRTPARGKRGKAAAKNTEQDESETDSSSSAGAGKVAKASSSSAAVSAADKPSQAIVNVEKSEFPIEKLGALFSEGANSQQLKSNAHFLLAQTPRWTLCCRTTSSPNIRELSSLDFKLISVLSVLRCRRRSRQPKST